MIIMRRNEGVPPNRNIHVPRTHLHHLHVHSAISPLSRVDALATCPLYFVLSLSSVWAEISLMDAAAGTLSAAEKKTIEFGLVSVCDRWVN